MALILFLIVPAVLVGFVWLGVSVYTRYRDNRLEGYEAIDDIGVGGAWKSHTPELPLVTVYYQEAEREFDRVYKAALARFPKDYDYVNIHDQIEKRIHPRNEVAAWNEAADYIAEWLKNKRVVHLTGNQNCDFYSGHQRREYVESEPSKAKGRVIDQFMDKHGFTENTLVNIVLQKMHDDTRQVNSQRIRDDERKRMSEKFIADLKEIQGKFVVEQEFLKAEVEDRDVRIAQLSEERDSYKNQMLLMKAKENERVVSDVVKKRAAQIKRKSKNAKSKRKRKN